MMQTSETERLRFQLVAAEFLERMGARLEQRRKDLGLSRSDVARRMPGKVGENQVYRWERGKHQPNPDTLEALAAILERDVAYFLSAPAPAAAEKTETPDVLASMNGSGPDVLARLTAIEERLDRLASRLEVGISNQEKLLAGLGADQDDYFETVKQTLADIAMQLAPEAAEPPAKRAAGRGRSTPRAA